MKIFELGNDIKEQIHHKAVHRKEVRFVSYINYTQFPASMTSELNYIITFYDIIIASRLGFSKEADSFKDLSLYV